MSEHIDGIYARVWQPTVKEAGGTVWLAASMERSHSEVSLRVRHAADSKGDLKESTLSMLGHIGPDENARRTFINLLCDEWDFEHPKPKQRKTVDEKLRALVKRLRAAGELGEAAIARAAKDIGADVSEFDS